MGFNVGMLGQVLGFPHKGRVRDPYKDFDIFDREKVTENLKKILGIHGEGLDALRSGDINRFLPEYFESIYQENLVPLRGLAESGRERISRGAARYGATDPIAQARLLEDLDRRYGSQVASLRRGVTGQKGQFLRDLLGEATRFTEGQQGLGFKEHIYETEYQMERKKEKAAYKEEQARVFRKWLMMIMGGGGGGIASGGMLGGIGGGGGFGGGFGGSLGNAYGGL